MWFIMHWARRRGDQKTIRRAAEVVRQQDERYGAARLALARIAREVSMAFLSENWDANRYRDRVTLFVGREDELLFTTLAHVRLYRDVKESDQAVVEYRLDADPDHPSERALFRREKARLDDEPDRGGRRPRRPDFSISSRSRTACARSASSTGIRGGRSGCGSGPPARPSTRRSSPPASGSSSR